MRHAFAAAAVAAALTTALPASAADVLPRAKPDEVGLSAERLGRIATVLNADVAAGRIPGAVVAIVRKNKLVYFEAFGYRDKAANVAMTTDTIFNIASMTKPMVAVGALMLAEQGQLSVGDPLSRYLPEFATMKVAQLDASGQTITGTVPAERPIRLQDLFRHTSGLIYGGRGATAVHKQYPAGSSAAAVELDGPAFLKKLAGAPLLHQPGTVWDYGFGLDVLGLVIEKQAKQPLDAFLAEKVFQPLGMTDTYFTIPADKAARYAKALPNDPETGQPQRLTPNALEPTKFACGGGCVASTASDYLRFALMLMHGGALGETRLLGRKTVEYMLSDHLGPHIKNLVGNADPTRAEYGFGLGLAVRHQAAPTRVMGSVGDFTWPGASGTNWWVDPKEELAVVFMAHSPGTIRWHYRQVINALVYQALAG